MIGKRQCRFIAYIIHVGYFKKRVFPISIALILYRKPISSLKDTNLPQLHHFPIFWNLADFCLFCVHVFCFLCVVFRLP